MTRTLAVLAVTIVFAPGCATPLVLDRCWKPAWEWAREERLEATFQPRERAEPACASLTPRVAEVEDEPFGHSLEQGGDEEKALIDLARGPLREADRVLASYRAWPGEDGGDESRALLFVSDEEGEPALVLRQGWRWRRYGAIELGEPFPVPARQALVCVGLAPVLASAVGFDAALVAAYVWAHRRC